MLFTFLSVDAVPRRMWVKPHAIYTLEYQSNYIGISPITGKHASNPAKFSVLSHLCVSCHKVDFDDFKILSFCSDSHELMIHESFLINKYKHTLNVQGSSILLTFSSSTVFVCKCPRCLNCNTLSYLVLVIPNCSL